MTGTSNTICDGSQKIRVAGGFAGRPDQTRSDCCGVFLIVPLKPAVDRFPLFQTRLGFSSKSNGLDGRDAHLYI